jgi:hypothetical protein
MSRSDVSAHPIARRHLPALQSDTGLGSSSCRAMARRPLEAGSGGTARCEANPSGAQAGQWLEQAIAQHIVEGREHAARRILSDPALQ